MSKIIGSNVVDLLIIKLFAPLVKANNLEQDPLCDTFVALLHVIAYKYSFIIFPLQFFFPKSGMPK